jgi:hypothetical protein
MQTEAETPGRACLLAEYVRLSQHLVANATVCEASAPRARRRSALPKLLGGRGRGWLRSDGRREHGRGWRAGGSGQCRTRASMGGAGGREEGSGQCRAYGEGGIVTPCGSGRGAAPAPAGKQHTQTCTPVRSAAPRRSREWRRRLFCALEMLGHACLLWLEVGLVVPLP